MTETRPPLPAQTASSAVALGLGAADARRLLDEQGPNEIARAKGPSALAILLGQFRGAMIWLLAGAAVVSALLQEIADAVAIAVILVLNALVGFLQEYRAERAVQALRAMTAPHARVLRDGTVIDVAAREVVPGDVLVLEAGDLVAADAVLVEAHELCANEAALTGESVPVDKSAGGAVDGGSLAERRGRVFAGTAVATGTGRAVVDGTGMKSELGRIAGMLTAAVDEETPLQRRLEKVGRTLLVLCAGVVVAVAIVGLLRGVPLAELLLSAVSLAVAAVPEGLAAIVTIALAIGVQRMAAQHVLIRRLPAVETLGCATVICTDKTGTLTTGTMVVREVAAADPERLLDAAAACCDADLEGNTGDPTEIALLRAAFEHGIARADIERERPRIVVNPFDTRKKRMSILRGDGVLYVKGAVETVAALSSSGDVAGAAALNEAMAARGLRVLAVAVGRSPQERELELLGLVGIADPPRTEAIEAVAHARSAGIRTVMITGDHPTTAKAIAREMGILRPGEPEADVVHARAAPEEKLAIVRAWKARGDVVAMTGDGVNDAPALREAHIGIAMGKTGTEVTREASDMILTDDNFASIVAAVREGRGIFDNIQKALVYLLAGNAGELLVFLCASLLGMPLPLTPLQLLWINLVTDGLPALALVMDPTDDDVLERKPRSRDEAILGRRQWALIGFTGVLQAAVTLGAFAWGLSHAGVDEARNLAFSTLVFGEVFRAFSARSVDKVFWEVGAFTNVRLLLVVVATALVQIGIHWVPLTEGLFSVGHIDAAELGLALLLGLVPVTVVEMQKLARRLVRRASPR